LAKYIGTLTSDARGKVGGLVLTRARNGTNIRAMAVPVNPATTRQIYTRGIIGAALSAYRQLTAPQQGSWSLFAALYTWTNSLAQPFTPTGLQLWTQAYVNATRFGTTPPGSWSGTPPVLYPVTAASLVYTSGNWFLFATRSTPGIYYPFIVYASGVVPSSVNYVRRLARRYITAVSGVYYTNIAPGWTAAYGSTPRAGLTIAVCVTSVDPTTYISAAPFVSALTSG
jgi:hypothetical protein